MNTCTLLQIPIKIVIISLVINEFVYLVHYFQLQLQDTHVRCHYCSYLAIPNTALVVCSGVRASSVHQLRPNLAQSQVTPRQQGLLRHLPVLVADLASKQVRLLLLENSIKWETVAIVYSHKWVTVIIMYSHKWVTKYYVQSQIGDCYHYVQSQMGDCYY